MKNTTDWVEQVIQSSKPPDTFNKGLVINSQPLQKFSDKYLQSSSSGSDSDSSSVVSKPQPAIRSINLELSSNSFINKITSNTASNPQPLPKHQFHSQMIIEDLESAANYEGDDFWKKDSSSDSSNSSFGDTDSEIESTRKPSIPSGKIQSNLSAAKPLETKAGGVFGVESSQKESISSEIVKENKTSIHKPKFAFDVRLEDLKYRDSRVSNASESKPQISKLAIPTFEDIKIVDNKVDLGNKKSLPADATKSTAINFRFPKDIPPPIPQSFTFQTDSHLSAQPKSSLPPINSYKIGNSRPKIAISSQPKPEELKISPTLMSTENPFSIDLKSPNVPSIQVEGKYIHSPTEIDLAGKYITTELSSSSSEEPSVRHSNIHLQGLPVLRYEASKDRPLSIDLRAEESADESKINIPKLPSNIMALATYSKPNLINEFPKIQNDSEVESLESSSDSSIVGKVQITKLQLGSPLVIPPKHSFSPQIQIQMPLSSPSQTDEMHIKPYKESETSSRYSEIRTSIALQSPNDTLTIEEAFSILYTENLVSEINKISKQLDKSSKGGCFGCFSGKSNKLVNRTEKDVRNRILALSLVKFNDLNPFHTRILMSIWRLITGAFINCPRIGEQWKLLGFKTTDPAQELDSAGVLGLFLLLFLSSIFTADVKKMIERSKHPQLGFHFAQVSIIMARIAVSISKERKLNAIINKRNPANEVILFFYAGLMIQWFLTYLPENFDETRGLAYIKEIEQYAKKHPDEILMLAKSRLNQIQKNSS